MPPLYAFKIGGILFTLICKEDLKDENFPSNSVLIEENLANLLAYSFIEELIVWVTELQDLLKIYCEEVKKMTKKRNDDENNEIQIILTHDEKYKLSYFTKKLNRIRGILSNFGGLVEERLRNF